MAVKSSPTGPLVASPAPWPKARPARRGPSVRVSRNRTGIRARRANPMQQFLRAIRHPASLVALLMGAQVILYSATVAHEGHLDRLRRQLEAEGEYNVRLRADLAGIRSLDRVDERARAMGFVTPTILAYLPSPDRTAPARPLEPMALGAAAAY